MFEVDKGKEEQERSKLNNSQRIFRFILVVVVVVLFFNLLVSHQAGPNTHLAVPMIGCWEPTGSEVYT